MIGHIVVHILARAFYAMQDTRTPVTWAIVAVAINVPLMVLLVGPMGVNGLALALSIAAIIEVIGLLWSLRGRLEGIEGRSILWSLIRAGLAAVVAGAVMAGGLASFEALFPDVMDDAFGRLLLLLVLSGLGGIAFVAVAGALRSPELTQLRDARPAAEVRVIRLRPATEADAQGWSAFLAATASGDFLHDWAWADVAAFDGQPQRRYVLEDDGAIVAIVAAQVRPVFGGREFWYVPHGPVLDYDDPRAGIGCGRS